MQTGTEEVDYSEDLLRLAVSAADAAPAFCRDCRDYHLSWPALRLIETTGLDSDRPRLLHLFRDLAEGGRRRWMVAGMADSGLAATVGAAVWPVHGDAVITLVDRCETPLALCREVAARAGRTFRTFSADLMHFQPAAPQDVIVAHSVLSHLPGEARAAVARRFREWLGPDGRLVLTARIDDELSAEEERTQRSPAHLAAIRDALRTSGLDDEALLDRICPAIGRQLAVRSTRRGIHPTAEDVARLLRAGGFATVDVVADYVPPPRQIRPSGRRARRAILMASVS